MDIPKKKEGIQSMVKTDSEYKDILASGSFPSLSIEDMKWIDSNVREMDKGILSVSITEEMFIQAKEDSKNIKEQKGVGNKTSIVLTEDNDFIGSLAQNGVFRYLDLQGIQYTRSRFFDSSIHKDSYDFLVKDKKWDVKGSPKDPKYEIGENSRYLVMLDDKEKIVDYYLFVKVDVGNKIIYIPGYIGYKEFWEGKGALFISPKVKYPCWYILGKDIISKYKKL